MIVTYDDVKLYNAEILHIKRDAVWDDSHTDLLYTLWNIGLVAVYAPNGYPPGVSTQWVREGGLGYIVDNVALRKTVVERFFAAIIALAKRATDPVRAAAAALRGVDAKKNRVFLRDMSLGEGRRRPRESRPSAPGTGGSEFLFSGDGGCGPILTDLTLRNRLMTPRGKLTITGFDWSAGNDARPKTLAFLESPKPPYVCDPANGPHPIACDVIQGNDMSMAVYFEIQTAVLPCEDQSDRLVLSHRWQMSHTHDENQYLARVIDGEVVLNGSMINTFGINPDFLRSQLFHPIPAGCYRTVPHVTPSVDGLTYTYQTIDTDQTITFDAGDSGATHIEIAEKLAYYRPWKAQVVGT